jgi:predicted dienelactone hydrolase
MKKIVLITIALIIGIELLGQIGIEKKIFEDKSRNRTLKTYIIYPGFPDSTKSVAGNRVFKGFNATINAKINIQDKLPLIILVHGTSGNWKNLTWLGSKLVKKGAIVVAANHPGSTTGDASPQTVIQAWNQPKDVSFILSELLSSSFSKHIDTNNISIIGSSLGGYTALALAGAKLEFEKFPAFSKSHNDVSSTYFRPALDIINDEFILNANQSHTDLRVNKAIALVPGFVEVMQSESLNNLNAPTLIIGAELDENIPPNTHYKPFLKNLAKNSKYEEIIGASHYSFLQICQPDALKILKEENAEFACIELGNKSRQEIHNETFSLIDSFLFAK